MRSPMTKQHNDTYGLNLSPILANFQNTPTSLLRISVYLDGGERTYPVLRFSSSLGACAFTYVQTQIIKSSTSSNDSKLKNAL